MRTLVHMWFFSWMFSRWMGTQVIVPSLPHQLLTTALPGRDPTSMLEAGINSDSAYCKGDYKFFSVHSVFQMETHLWQPVFPLGLLPAPQFYLENQSCRTTIHSFNIANFYPLLTPAIFLRVEDTVNRTQWGNQQHGAYILGVQPSFQEHMAQAQPGRMSKPHSLRIWLRRRLTGLIMSLRLEGCENHSPCTLSWTRWLEPRTSGGSWSRIQRDSPPKQELTNKTAKPTDREQVPTVPEIQPP